MFLLLSVLFICITVVFVIDLLQKKPITFIVHKKIEEIRPAPAELSKEDKDEIEKRNQTIDGINEVIRFTQEFLGGDIDAESESKAK